MPSIQHQDYKGYAIVAMATPAGRGKYHSVCSVSLLGLPDLTEQPLLEHRETVTDSPTFATEAEAIDAAQKRAKSWIEAHAK